MAKVIHQQEHHQESDLILIENVPEFDGGDNRESPGFAAEVGDFFHQAGYVWCTRLVSAPQFGGCQQRKRFLGAAFNSRGSGAFSE